MSNEAFRGGPPRTNALDEALCGFRLKDGAVEQPGPLAERMDRVEVTLFSGDAKYFGADAKPSGGFAQVHPTLSFSDLRTMHGYVMVAAQRGYSLTGKAIAVSGAQIITIEQASDHIVAANAREQAHRFDDFLCGAVALSTPPARQA